ncbi:MAG TPA: HU family DNA-binding protein [Mycobacteriales bacterium]|nr:HU family DNA-binding protein [Mycobacteriales bacterium]
MNKAELIEVISDHLGDRRAAKNAVEVVVDTITRTVAKGEKVAISGFGVFERLERPARLARNPATGERVRVRKTAVPKFRPGSQFKDVVSGAKKLPKTAASTGRSAAGAATATARGAAGTTSRVASATKTATKTAATKAAATAKTAATKTAATKSGASKTAATKTAATKMAATKTTATKPAAVKTAATKTAATKTAATKRAATKTAAQPGTTRTPAKRARPSAY